MVRIDSTATDAPIHAPSDSTLLWDAVRTLVRLLKAAEEIADGVVTIKYRNHQRVAKKRMRAILYTRGMDKKARLYRDLIEVTEKSLVYAVLVSDPFDFDPFDFSDDNYQNTNAPDLLVDACDADRMMCWSH